MVIILLVTMSSLFIGLTAMMFNDIAQAKKDMSNSTEINAQLVGDYTVIPLLFGDKQGATEVISRLTSIPSIINARLYDRESHLFASFDRDNSTIVFPSKPTEQSLFSNGWLYVWKPIIYKDEFYGSIYIRASTKLLDKKRLNYLFSIVSLMILLALIAFYFANRLQRFISDPILELASVVKNITNEEDYSFRANKKGNDEVGVLYDAFNNMVDNISKRRSERDCALQELFEEKEWAQVTLQSIGDGVITTDIKGNIQFLNSVAEQLTGWKIEETEGKELNEIFKTYNEITNLETENPVAQCLREKSTIELTHNTVLITKSGEHIAIEDSAAPIRNQDDEIIGVVLVFHDVTAARKLSQQLSYQAQHDMLTDLINRREFENRLSRSIIQAQEKHFEHAMLYMDLDQFKIVNDTCGHVAGDELLRQITSLLQFNMRQRDTLARLGGDEFALLLEHCGPEEALKISEHLCQTIQEFRFIWEDHSFSVGVSIGLVPINKDSVNLSSVLSIADSACYSAKDAGRNRVHSYKEDSATVTKRHGEMQWVTRINRGLDLNQFILYHQEISPIGTRVCNDRHFEILIRMQDESGNIISPGAFLPAAERYNLMPTLDRWVVGAGLKSLSNRANIDDLGICSINLSGHSVGDNNFLEYVISCIDESKIPPEKICFEITETATIVNLTSATRFIKALKNKGCLFALDDFGAGMSSFLYLKNLPVDFLKIDGGFVRDIVHDPMDLALVKSINDIGHVMGMQTIAEFVESEEILEKLRSIGVDYAQGYYLAKPKLFV